MSSLIFWGIAELPQIVTNFRNKSGHGVSAALLLTWFIGDIFNLIGCRLEPATLPTQFYTALLYTTVTVVLLLQTFYYYYYIKHSKDNGFMNYASADGNDNGLDAKQKPLIDPKPSGAAKPVATTINTWNRASPSTDFFYTSARSLARSGTPSYLQTTYLGRVGSGPSAIPYMSSDEDDDDGNNTNIKPKFTSIYQAAGYSTVVLGSAGLPARASAFEEAQIPFQARRLFKYFQNLALEANIYGITLGWIMAAIYMGGRIPQIYLNFKRRGVEGLNPLMFIFAIIANVTYVGSILVRSVEWTRIKANAPWLFDAIVCVLLDLFIMIQFAYYCFLQKRIASKDGSEDEGSTEAKNKVII
ncbi:hypothetical protein HPP92_003236 [Vanilla planifolia]|uniref:PQ-loop repeat family protein / transmembrane family protein n=1 Tax=Vanilla planifolia TaxID=51239 RepID=A0A835S2V5_VANPL|nr:hypothetical protein HPP92_003236 [Vanilla planifolia]